MTLLHSALRQYTLLDGTVFAQHHQPDNHIIISRETFDQLCKQCQVDDSAAALTALEEAAAVVSLHDGKLVHLRPVLYVNTLAAMEAGGQAAAGNFLLEKVEQNIQALEAEELRMRKSLEPAIAKAARWRRTLWGGSLLLAGCQLAIISRLTYFDLDWDIMEPVSYIVGIGTALAFYVYFLRYDVEHTYENFDQRYLVKKVRQYAPKDFDWNQYEKTCRLLVEEKDIAQRLTELSRQAE
ncbi:hypothetical protein AGDE_09732 [Angomonas deanei]|nr:hypothetical protein AGDE_09732 [Angomonas deanei]|eukprot:EPY29878.1 hypothetical protein AGDE_09732 [Angomonas deanei]